MKQTILRLLILFAGLVVAHLGVSLFLLADLGSDPFNVMIQGLSRMMDIGFMTHGNTHMAITWTLRPSYRPNPPSSVMDGNALASDVLSMLKNT